MSSVLIKNSRYEILTPSGFKPFDGVRISLAEKCCQITFTDGSCIITTLEHLFNTIPAKKITTKSILNGKKVVSNRLIKHNDLVYDLVNVSGGSLYYTNNVVSHNCSFEGSSYTLIDGQLLATIPTKEPEVIVESVKMYERPIKGNSYVVTVDTSRGQNLDFSAFVVFDITQMPYRVVATFKDNNISTSVYPVLIHRFAELYNQAYILVEINDIGGEIANVLWYDLEYPNLYLTTKSEKLSDGKGYPGVRTTKRVKMIGCQTLKDLIESKQLLFSSFDILRELSVFVQKRTSYAADDTSINDDLTACLWLFAWMTKQPVFTALTSNDTRATLAYNREKQITDSVVPFGYIVDAVADEPVGLSADQSFDDWFYKNGKDELQIGETIDDWIMK